ncbi:hypothetical protein A8C56_17645 [Niabella ginsenosidivorans]|uniref:HTH marR-type domain-containing protein n=1 Tax=Niabella ginsenosidivorans TaxID=1176587 RepID=A0A1A9I4K0_9BACT|nr:MarR family transcriptional regulator [Niabella ginsenosidivorans]ANH82556.1 hypothetical protein A8C56_17645 [Niabella ginsenosidivorans]
MKESEILNNLSRAISRKIGKLNSVIRTKLTAEFNAQGLDLTAEMYSVLRCLWEKNGVNQQELAEMSYKEKANLTKLIDHLERRGLVYREMNQADKRNKLIFLTPRANAIKGKVLRIAQKSVLVPESNIPEQKLRIAREVLDTLLEQY